MAKAGPTSIHLTWQSATEIDFEGYELQRSSDALAFERIAWVPGQGGDFLQDYRYEDSDVTTNSTYYYRLKMLDQDGQFEYSPVRSAKVQGPSGELKIYPNPAKEVLFVSLFSENQEAMSVDIFNEMGSLVFSRKYQLTEGENLLQLPLDELPTGWFVLRAASGNTVASEKFFRM